MNKRWTRQDPDWHAARTDADRHCAVKLLWVWFWLVRSARGASETDVLGGRSSLEPHRGPQLRTSAVPSISRVFISAVLSSSSCLFDGHIYPTFTSAGIHWPNLNVDSHHLNSSPGPQDKAEIGFLIQFSWILHKDSRDPACIKQKEVAMPKADNLDCNSENVFVFSSFLHFSAFIPLRLLSVDLWESRGFCFHFIFWIRCIFDTSVA